MIIRYLFILACISSGTAYAAPPPGHPTIDEASRFLNLPRDKKFANQGEVLQAIDSNAYTYIEVLINNQKLWLAAPRLELKPGQQIRFPSGTIMHNFYSRKLQRTFGSVVFVSAVDVLPEPT